MVPAQGADPRRRRPGRARDQRPARHLRAGLCRRSLLYLATTDEEEKGDYWITRVDPRPATPVITDLARIPFAARALAFDGERFWTNHREQEPDRVVCGTSVCPSIV
jgi:hypothetical protein